MPPNEKRGKRWGESSRQFRLSRKDGFISSSTPQFMLALHAARPNYRTTPTHAAASSLFIIAAQERRQKEPGTIRHGQECSCRPNRTRTDTRAFSGGNNNTARSGQTRKPNQGWPALTVRRGRPTSQTEGDRYRRTRSMFRLLWLLCILILTVRARNWSRRRSCCLSRPVFHLPGLNLLLLFAPFARTSAGRGRFFARIFRKEADVSSVAESTTS